jgi:regulator-associated protein of mTOR
MTAVTARRYHQSAYPQQQQHQHAPAASSSSSSRAPAGPPPHHTDENTAHATTTHFPNLSTLRSTRDNPDPLTSGATMPSRLGNNGMFMEGDRPLPVRNRRTEPIDGQLNSATDSSDSDHRVIGHPSDQKKLSIITSHDDGDHGRSQRRKPPLLRSKSDYVVRRDDQEPAEDEIYEWGARHGFEDHYQSEDIISQLANVSDLNFHHLIIIRSWRCGSCSELAVTKLHLAVLRYSTAYVSSTSTAPILDGGAACCDCCDMRRTTHLIFSDCPLN